MSNSSFLNLMRSVELTRRDATLALAAVSGLASVRTTAWAQAVINKWYIDTHCHVFNGRDVPARNFVLHVIARELGISDHFDALVKAGAEMIRTSAPTYKKERDHLVALPPGVPLAALELSDQEFKSYVEGTLTGLAAESRFSSSPVSGQPNLLDELRTRDLLTGPVIRRAYPSPEANTLDDLYSLYQRRSPLAMVLADVRRPDVALHFAELTDEKSRSQLASQIVEDSKKESKVGLYWSFVRCFCSYRASLVEKLDAAFGFDKPDTVRIYTPALIDYDRWLNQPPDEPSTPMAEQTALLSIISRRTKPNVLVNGFVAFDPLRSVLDVIRGNDGAYKTMTHAVEKEGFIGVKVYPPMGFRPIDNDDPGIGFGPHLPELLASDEWKDIDLPLHKLGKELDDQLLRLYVYCLKNDVPILTHCGNSQTAFTYAGERADPVFWKRVLDRNDAPTGYKFSNLRLNLGHFGGLWCHDMSKPPRPTADPDASENRCIAEWDWPEAIMKMVSAGPADRQDYPNLYFDVADTEALAKGGAAARTMTAYVNDVYRRQVDAARVVSRILYGTDWMFVSLYPGYKQFDDNAGVFQHDIKGAEADIFWRNARTFLGLNEGDKTLVRLRAFYAGSPNQLRTLNNLAAAT